MRHGNRLDVVQTDWMVPGLYYRVHPTWKPGGKPGEILSPLAANPQSKGRLALPGDIRRSVSARAMFYVATSPAAALLESVLRHPVMVPGRRIDLSAAKLRGNTLSALHLLKPVPCVPLMMPERGLVVTDPRKEEEWRRILTTTRHADTHEAAADVAIQFASHSGDPTLTLAGFGYPSQQHSRSLVYLLYEPPTESRSWRIERSTDLESVEGRREAVIALADIGLLAFVEVQGAGDPAFEAPECVA